MQAWESVQETLEWIANNLSERIDITQLAAVAHLSNFYYQRLFSRLVGKPVMEYVKLRRLAGAADTMAGLTDAKYQGRILDLALDFGFENHETFTRAFKDTYGLTPEEYRAAPRPLSHFQLPDLSMMYRIVDENIPLAAQGIVLEVRRTVLETPRYYLGLTLQNPLNDTPGIDFLGELWAQFHTIKPTVPDLLPEGNELGVSYAGESEGCFTYFAGAEARGTGGRRDLAGWALDTGSYIICAFEAENFHLLTTDALNKARDYMLGVWLPRHSLSIEPFMAELYDQTDPDASSMEIWFRAKPI